MEIKTYLNTGYFDESGNYKREIYIDWAKAIASKLKRDKMTSASIRRFYGRVRALSTMFRDEETFQRNKHELQKLIPLVYYSLQRDQANVPESFKDFLEVNVRLAEQSLKDFKAFVDHFQSVVAFFPKEDQKGNRKGK
ncbi:type III-A CRISPR-associated protein Csm2 [Aeribacillus sp. FSL K6-1121]|jgi:CRISPR type III-A-associated protein Csm2|uniref:type III-A CRISPR-associated protein Csm2 n=1 Tax=Aeribacillus TaxID=1055323 RepID=UPI0010230782|nr:type III-A CRISPR-associated protein Csm2 [Aeribacillus pallidus]RZI50706.1 type III-A CRISPR-associated protein Csm2 [Aeribacillus pallidus]